MSHLRYALAYIGRGLRVFPCRPGAKIPIYLDGYKAATCAGERIRAWWGEHPAANIGVACGLSRLVIVDLDGPDALALWQERWAGAVDAARGEGEPLPPIALTPRPGLHLYFQTPKGVAIPSSAGKLGAGIDVKSDGGHVILPPSLHPNGGRYRWAPPGTRPDEAWRLAVAQPGAAAESLDARTRRPPDGLPRGFPVLPAALVEFLVRKPRTGRTRPTRAAAVPRAYAVAALLRAADEVRATGPGGRNNRLFAAACSVGRFVVRGELPADEFERALVAAGCDAGLPEEEARQAVANGLHYAEMQEAGDAAGDAGLIPAEPQPPEPQPAASRPGETPRRETQPQAAPQPEMAEEAEPREGVNPLAFALTDTGHGLLLNAAFGDRLRYEHGRERWLYYDGVARWRGDDKRNVENLVVRCGRLIRDAALVLPDDVRRPYTAAAARLENVRSIRATLERAASLPELAVSTEELDTHLHLLGCTNGVVDLRTGAVARGERELLLTLSTRLPYDPSAECPRWERFLREVFNGDEELVDYIQKATGYSISGEVKEHIVLLCWGSGANGKSTFLTTLHRVFGDYALAAPEVTFEPRNHSFRTANSNDVAALAGRRFVTVSETAQHAQLNEARLKQMSGGDVLQARFLNREFFEFMPQFTVWLATNHKPRLTGDDAALWRRVKLIPFTRSFAGREDRELAATLANEAPGILAWAVRGAVSYYHDRGLQHPALVQEATQLYRDECDPFPRFVAEHLERRAGVTTASKEIYERYVAWVTEEDGKPLSHAEMSKRLKELGYTSERKRAGAQYPGVALAE